MSDSARRANESPRSGIILNSKGSLCKLAAENKQEGPKLSSFAPSEQVTQSAPAIIQRLFSSSNSSNIVEQPQNLLVSESRMIRRNLFPSIPIPTQQTTRIIMVNLVGALITSLFLYFIVCSFTTFGHWEGKVVENQQPAFELGRFHRDHELAPLSFATPSHVYCRLNSATHLDSLFSDDQLKCFSLFQGRDKQSLLTFRASKIDFEIDFEGEITVSKILLEVSETQYATYLKERTLVTISANIKNERQLLSESRIESKHKIGFNEINSAFVLSIHCEECEKRLLRKLYFTIDSNLFSHTLLSAAILVKN